MIKWSKNPFALTSFFGIKLKEEEKNNGGVVFKSVLHNMSEKTYSIYYCCLLSMIMTQTT